MRDLNKTDFWQYAYSDFFDNRNRGMLGEFLVATALSITNTPETSWESYDLLTNDGIKIEVKTSGYVQSWHWNGEKTRPVFGIPKKQGWKGETSEWDGKKDRHADVYVFCLHTAESKEGSNPLNTDEWEFYVVATKDLPEQDTISLGPLTSLTEAVSFEELKHRVTKASRLT